MFLEIKKLSPKARMPFRASVDDAGYDLYSVVESVVPKGDRRLISTGISMTVPEGHYGRIAPRSGLAVKHGISTGAGVIDASFTGEVQVLLFNHGDSELRVNEGDRIAQLLIEKISLPEIKEVQELKPTSRAAKGFGSSGR